jgi:hypothetical protein
MPFDRCPARAAPLGQSDRRSSAFRMPEAPASRLHALGHCAGNTLILLGGPAADISTLSDLHCALQELVKDSTLFETAVALSSCSGITGPFGYLEPAEASHLGIEGSTLLAVRPDGYIGLRCDRDHLNTLERYAALIQTGRMWAPPAIRA